MIELIEANWPLFLIALLIGIAVAWFIFVANRRTSVATDRKDVLDEGAAPTSRNQALIDAAPASAQPVVPPVAAPGLAGAGTAVEIAAKDAMKQERDAPAEPAKSVAPTPSADSDDLTRLKGVGPKLHTRLRELGVTSFAQIAAWDDTEIDRIDAQLDRFAGRIRRDDWVTQASLLDRGDMAAYAAKFGNL